MLTCAQRPKKIANIKLDLTHQNNYIIYSNFSYNDEYPPRAGNISRKLWRGIIKVFKIVQEYERKTSNYKNMYFLLSIDFNYVIKDTAHRTYEFHIDNEGQGNSYILSSRFCTEFLLKSTTIPPLGFYNHTEEDMKLLWKPRSYDLVLATTHIHRSPIIPMSCKRLFIRIIAEKY